MQCDPAIRCRRSIRLRGFDNRAPGLYVVTIWPEHRAHLFGQITDSEMALSPAGEVVLRTWNEIPGAYPGVEIDALVVMPNHVMTSASVANDDCRYSMWSSGTNR